MQRFEDFKSFSDGRIYGLNDMVKADCHDCRDCHKCCSQDMGKSITLDPLDIYRLTAGTGKAFEALVGNEIELSVIDGIIIPNMLMSGAKEGCRFLNEKGRCSIHPYRPGICRLFPLGRIYQGQDFSYFLQINECSMKNRSKVKVSKWIDTPDLDKYTAFVRKWHNFTKMAAKKAANLDEGVQRKLMLYILQVFYSTPYNPENDFYPQFDERFKIAVREINHIK
ncbi:YkgJ family cysteine cluster protein [Eubacterium ruminantium]|uniref:YkgJ family cysteine cluster protein n=1 Tax=Eubacterium ruminantium TaxID=42322 RepID=UPI0015682E93|nr:YkgJ family cysteine cluster protein [Eubacterium ruminantium]